MNFFESMTAIVEIDEENQIHIHKLTFGERQAALAAALTSKRNAGEKEVTDLNLGILARERAILCIDNWEGPGFAGRPVTRQNILALPPNIVDKVSDALAGLGGEEMEPDQKKA